MNTIRVDVLNPASLALLEDLEKLQLIAIHRSKKAKSPSCEFIDLVQKLRSKSQDSPSLEEITAEVEQQRSEMYAIATEKDENYHRY